MRLTLALLLAFALLAACQPPSSQPDAQSPTPAPVRLVSAEGTGRATLEIAGQQISVSIETETREGADPCVRALASWGLVQVPWSSGCEDTAAPTPAPAPEARPESDAQ